MKIFINGPFHLIQQIRLIQAIAEWEIEVIVPETEKEKFTYIKRYFNLNLSYGKHADYDITNDIQIDHKLPQTSLGNITRSLIFPHSVFHYCRSRWQQKRRHRFAFAGLITEKRQEILASWMQKNLKSSPNPAVFFAPEKHAPYKQLLHWLGFPNKNKTKIDNFLLWSSTRGRNFPIKSWDREYFDILSNTDFVLCPSGDYVWSYRFFEAIMSGAIPVVEKNCPAFEGFKFFYMDDDIQNFERRIEDVEHNYQLCIEKLTISKSELVSELIRLAKCQYRQ